MTIFFSPIQHNISYKAHNLAARNNLDETIRLDNRIRPGLLTEYSAQE